MPLTLLRHATQKPPVGPLKLDIGHPLAQGLVGALVCNELGSGTIFDVMSRGVLSVKGGAIWGSVAGGTNGGFITNGTGQGAEVVAPTSVQLQPPLTLVWKGVKLGAPADYSGIAGVSYTNSDSSPYAGYWFDYNGSTQNIRFSCNGATVSEGAIEPNGPLWLAGTLTASAQNLFINNPTAAVASGGGTASLSYATSLLFLGGLSYVSRNSNMLSECSYAYNRILNSGELAWLKAEPYCMWQTRPIQRWITVASAAAFDPATVPWSSDTPVSPGLALVGF